MAYRPDTLVLSSGSDKGMAEVGVLDRLSSEGVLSEVKTIIGCSVGAIIGYLLAIGCTPHETMIFGLSLHLFENSAQLGRLAQEYAVCDHSVIIDKLTQITLLKLRKLPTLLELYHECGYHFIAPTVNTALEIPAVIYNDYLIAPEMLALEAVKRSMSIQPLFPPVYDNGGTYVDGAIIDPFPIQLMDDGLHNVLGIHCEVTGGTTGSFVDHMMLISSVVVDQIKRLKIQRVSNKVKIITVRLANETITDDPSKRLDMFYTGYFEGCRFSEREVDGGNKPKKD